jgi:hypothetical protein
MQQKETIMSEDKPSRWEYVIAQMLHADKQGICMESLAEIYDLGNCCPQRLIAPHEAIN